MTHRYKPEILALLAVHGVMPKPTTPPTTARAVVNEIYRYELRLLRDRYLVGGLEPAPHALRIASWVHHAEVRRIAMGALKPVGLRFSARRADDAHPPSIR